MNRYFPESTHDTADRTAEIEEKLRTYGVCITDTQKRRSTEFRNEFCASSMNRIKMTDSYRIFFKKRKYRNPAFDQRNPSFCSSFTVNSLLIGMFLDTDAMEL